MIRKIIAGVAFVGGVLLWIGALVGWLQYLLGTPTVGTIYTTLVYMLIGGVLYGVAYAVSPGDGPIIDVTELRS